MAIFKTCDSLITYIVVSLRELSSLYFRAVAKLLILHHYNKEPYCGLLLQPTVFKLCGNYIWAKNVKYNIILILFTDKKLS